MAEVKAKSLAVLALAVFLPGAWISQGLADHDAVFPMPKDRQYVDECVELKRSLPIAARWRRARLEVSAFVQDQRTGRVLQAVGTGECLGS